MTDKDIEWTSIKIGILGDSQVGKTAICNTFIDLEFKEESISTIGAEKYEKKMIIEGDKLMKIVLWDTAGQERFRSAGLKAIRSVHGVALVFAVDNPQSFANVEKWLIDINDNMDKPCLVLLGNKVDIPEDEWKVKQEDIDELCEKKKLIYYGTSAKENKGITESFTYIANLVYKKVEENKKKNIKIDGGGEKPKKKCC